MYYNIIVNVDAEQIFEQDFIILSWLEQKCIDQKLLCRVFDRYIFVLEFALTVIKEKYLFIFFKYCQKRFFFFYVLQEKYGVYKIFFKINSNTIKKNLKN